MRCIKICVVFLSLSLAATPLVAVAQSIELAQSYLFKLDIQQLFEQGNASLDAGQLSKAEYIWNLIIQKDPKNAFAYYKLGHTLLEKAQPFEGIEAIYKAIQLDPNNALFYNKLGLALEVMHKREKAIAAYRKAIEINRNYSFAYLNLGKLTLNEDEAIAIYRKVLTLPDIPGKLTLDTLPGVSIFMLGTIGTRTIIRREPSAHTLAHYHLGLIHYKLSFRMREPRNLEEAIQEVQQAVKLDPNFTDAQDLLKEVQRQLALQKKPSSLITDDRQFVPSLQDEPLVNVLRSVVLLTVQTPTGFSVGTGWVVKREGNKAWIVTNAHVVRERSEKIELEFYSDPPLGKYRPRYPTKIVQITDTNNPLDLALLEVTGIPDDIKHLPIASGRVPRTTPVLIIGHPNNGGPWTSVPGQVSNFLSQERKLQIQATLAKGNSGGPVISNPVKCTQ